MSPKTAAKKATKSGFTKEERAAMRERVRELKTERAGADGEKDLLAKIAQMREPDKSKAKKVHAIVKATAPQLTSRTWYGMPAYANKDGKVVCFFQSAQKFNARYATIGFSDTAKLDDGNKWPIYFALNQVTTKEETKIAALIKKAVS
ncbi:MAG: iron chaperone [Actinomycetota bacterium]